MSAYSIATRGLAGRKIPQGVLAAINTLLFGASEQGALYDPADLSTLFQDTAGTTPVTAVEQAVALMLDKSGRGNHASQATSTKRPKYSRRVNRFILTEAQGGYIGGSGLVTVESLAGYAGSVKFGYDGSTSSWGYRDGAVMTGSTAILSVVVKMTDGTAPVTTGQHPGSDFVLVVNGAQAPTESIVSLGGGYYRVSSPPLAITANNAGVVKYYNNSPRTFKVTAYDLRLATDAHLPYQRVNTATDYDADPAKFPAYLRFDGVDDALQTGNIDFTGTDKMTVWAGVTNLGVGTSELYGLSTDPTSNPAVMLRPTGGGGLSGDLGAYSRGSGPFSAVYFGGAGNPPATLLTTAESSISAPYLRLRVNHTLSSQSTTGQGAGNYGNYPLYIGARAGTSLYFNGRLSSLIVRGAQSSLSQIEATEAYIKQKMRLP